MKKHWIVYLTKSEQETLGLDENETIEDVMKAIEGMDIWDEDSVSAMERIADRIDIDISECEDGEQIFDMIAAAIEA